MTATTTPLPEPDEFDVRDYIQDYADAKRLTPSRAEELLEKALAVEQPARPDPDVSGKRVRAACDQAGV